MFTRLAALTNLAQNEPDIARLDLHTIAYKDPSKTKGPIRRAACKYRLQTKIHDQNPEHPSPLRHAIPVQNSFASAHQNSQKHKL